jgi:hypothetical protein
MSLHFDSFPLTGINEKQLLQKITFENKNNAFAFCIFFFRFQTILHTSSSNASRNISSRIGNLSTFILYSTIIN